VARRAGHPGRRQRPRQRVDEISHGKYWPEPAIFIVEDDSQAGLDHVDGHRARSRSSVPWVQHGVVDNTYFVFRRCGERGSLL
jgi:hypothetical protein